MKVKCTTFDSIVVHYNEHISLCSPIKGKGCHLWLSQFSPVALQSLVQRTGGMDWENEKWITRERQRATERDRMRGSKSEAKRPYILLTLSSSGHTSTPAFSKLNKSHGQWWGQSWKICRQHLSMEFIGSRLFNREMHNPAHPVTFRSHGCLPGTIPSFHRCRR